MSVPNTEPITDVNTSEAAKNAADDADNHTPPSPVAADPPTPAADPIDGEGKKDDLHKIVTGLAEQLATLTSVVATISNPDQSPTQRVPWTHKGGHKS